MTEPVLEPELPIVDAHHHLWDREPLLRGVPETEHPFDAAVRATPRYLFEELLADDETTMATPHPKLRTQRPVAPPGPGWERRVREWLEQAAGLPDEGVREGLRRFVPDYRPAGVGASGPAAPFTPVEPGITGSDDRAK